MKTDRLDKYRVFKIIVMVYFMISPIFEVVYLYNHLTTLIRILVIFGFIGVTLILYPDARKSIKYLVMYFLAMGVYLAISAVHAQGFISLVPGDFNYSVASEATTLLKLCVPFMIVFVLRYVKFTKKEFFNVINVWVLIVAGSIVLLNLCGLSLSSYADAFTKYSIFSWGKDLSVREIATRGLFVYANQEVLILLMLLAMSVYETLFINKKWFGGVVLISLSMMMLGTRVTTYGGLLSVFALGVCYIIYSLVSKRKINKSIIALGALCLVWFLMLPITPCRARVDEIKRANETIIKQSKGEKSSGVRHEEVTLQSDFEIFEQNINKNIVGENFYLVYYPYEYDKEFWNGVLEKQGEIELNYRVLELMIVNRVIELDGRWTNYLFGISNTRIQNIINIEEDFVLHFYAFGVVGMIITLLFYGVSSVRLCLNLKTRKFIDFTILSCFGLFIIGALVSGNNVNFLAAVVPLGFIVSMSGKFNDC